LPAKRAFWRSLKRRDSGRLRGPTKALSTVVEVRSYSHESRRSVAQRHEQRGAVTAARRRPPPRAPDGIGMEALPIATDFRRRARQAAVPSHRRRRVERNELCLTRVHAFAI
jgi:hypothetical protein